MDSKDDFLHIRISKKRKLMLKQKSEESGMTMSQFLDLAILNKRVYRIDGLPELIVELSRIGNNINQIAAQVNTTKDVTAYQMELVDEKMKKVQHMMEYIIRKVQANEGE